MMRELDAALARCRRRPAIRAVILRGEGPAFCAGHDLRELRRPRRRHLSHDLRCLRRSDGADRGDSAAGHRRGRQGRDRGRLSARRRLRSRGRLDRSDVRDAGRAHRSLLQHADGGADARDRAQARDGDAAHRRSRSTRRRRWRGVSSIASSRPIGLHDETLALARKIASASRGIVGIGKAAFYAQIDLDQARAYAYAKAVMTSNALDADAREGIAAFLERRSPNWRH